LAQSRSGRVATRRRSYVEILLDNVAEKFGLVVDVGLAVETLAEQENEFGAEFLEEKTRSPAGKILKLLFLGLSHSGKLS
jgi:hypothetical protein